ncbi:MAG: hypothetical protein ACKOPO_08660 [Novosphingobium sp.]
MSTKLALSSALSVMLLAIFAVFSGATVNASGQEVESSVLNARIQLPSAPHLPEMPILR